MPLKKGYSYATVQYNIAELVASGHTRESATAAAKSAARAEFFRRFPHGAVASWLAFPRTRRMRSDYTASGKPLRVNPNPRDKEIRKVAKLAKDFSGHDAKIVGKVEVPPVPKTGLAIGKVLGIIYRTKRDGEIEDYIHRFTRIDARPLLVASPDGKQLLLIGGSYNFTERGIEDNA